MAKLDDDPVSLWRILFDEHSFLNAKQEAAAAENEQMIAAANIVDASGFEQRRVLLSNTENDSNGDETVYGIIRNDWAKDSSGNPLFGIRYSYHMAGFQLHGPIRKEPRGGFTSLEDAKQAARREYEQWRSGNVPPSTQVTRRERWEMLYRADRYLKHLTNDELAERLGIATNNLMNLTRGQQITPIAMDVEGDSITQTYFHVMEEFRLRGLTPTDDQIQHFRFPDYDWPLRQAGEAFDALNLSPGTFLIKYSKREFVEAALYRGDMRISPASAYNDPSLNFSIMDDELSIPLRQQDVSADQSTTPLSSATDYYVYCLANEFSLRLFGDFEADACLVIAQPYIFIDRLSQAVMKKLFLRQGLWQGYARPIQYVDPVQPLKPDVDIFCGKNFRFAYQHEYRMVWRPISPRSGLPFLYVQVGSLEDCCKIISLDAN
jgi:hypothetical protein